jgi:hypothetical protein
MVRSQQDPERELKVRAQDLESFREFIQSGIFGLTAYKAHDQYCVALLVMCEEPRGWVAVWRRCYGSPEKAEELLKDIEPLAKNRLRDLLLFVEIKL